MPQMRKHLKVSWGCLNNLKAFRCISRQFEAFWCTKNYRRTTLRTYRSKSSTNSTILRRSTSVPFRWKNVNIGWSSPGSWPLIPLLITTQETTATINRYQSRRVSGNGSTFLMIIRTPHFVTKTITASLHATNVRANCCVLHCTTFTFGCFNVACSLHNIKDTPYQKATLISFNWLVTILAKKQLKKTNRQCYITLNILQWC